MISSQPYTDQIWHASKCRDFESEVKKRLKQCIGNKNFHSQLVDAVKHDYESYDLVISDSIIKNFQYCKLWPEYWGSYSYDPVYNNEIPTKLFHCFIARTDLMRQSWFYQLVRRNLIDQGAVSFLLDYRGLTPTGFDVSNKLELYDWVFQQGCEIFAAEHNLMRKKVPFQNFSGDLDQNICDCKTGIVIETYFASNDVIAFSEKTFRALQLPRPFMLYCASGAVQVLRDQGFDMYDDVVDHSYDSEQDPIQRQIKILDQIELANEIKYDHLVLEDFESRANHNRNLLKKFKQQWPLLFEKTVAEILHYK